MAVRPGGKWTVADLPDLHGRTFLVTGANSGLGYATTRALARSGARVVMAVRDPAKGEAAAAALRAEQPQAQLDPRALDLSDLDSVRACVRGIRADRLPVDVLVNNAGVMMTPQALTRDGVELQFGTNHLGHFALTGLLLGTLRDGPGARVVTVTSELHRLGRGHFDDVTGTRRYHPARAYAQSKLANALFGLELERRLRTAAVPVWSLLAHPGYAATNLQLSGPTGSLRRLLAATNRLVNRDAAAGAMCLLYAAAAPQARGGQYVGPGGVGGMYGHPAVVRPSETAQDRELARRLWELSERLTGVRFGLPPD